MPTYARSRGPRVQKTELERTKCKGTGGRESEGQRERYTAPDHQKKDHVTSMAFLRRKSGKVSLPCHAAKCRSGIKAAPKMPRNRVGTLAFPADPPDLETRR